MYSGELAVKNVLGSLFVKKLLVVDRSVQDRDILLSGLSEAFEVREIPANCADPLGFIAACVKELGRVVELHVLSHGAPGCLQLAGQSCGIHAILNSAQPVRAIRDSLTDNAQIVLYGCRVAEGKAGKDFVTGLSTLLGSPVHASQTQVGHESLGGSWKAFKADLIPFDQASLAQFQNVLPTYNFTGATNNNSNIQQTVDGVLLTISDSRTNNVNWSVASAGGAGGTIDEAAVQTGLQTSYTFTFGSAIDVTSLRIVEGTTTFTASGTFTFTPNTGSAVTGVSIPQAGNFDGTTATLNFTGITSFTVTYSAGDAALVFDTVVFSTADTTPPGTLGTPDLSAATDLGSSNSDNITSSTTQTIGGTGAEASSIVHILVAGSTIASVNAEAGGTWTYTTTLAEGS